MTDLEKRLLRACKAQHQAIDLLMARLVKLDPNFLPNQSGLPWELMKEGHKAIKRAEATPPIGRGLPFKMLGIKVRSFETMASAISVGLEIRPDGIASTPKTEQVPTIAWRYTARGWLGWQVLVWIARHDKTRDYKMLHYEKQELVVYLLPDVAERMAKMIEKR